MTRYVIVGAGPAGLYTAYRLLTDGNLQTGDTVQVYEWSQRPGGRIYTYTFPDNIATDGLYCEVGGMRFAVDPNFFTNIADVTEGHVLVQNMIATLGLQSKVVPFVESPERMYYLRGTNIYENQITSLSNLPYYFNQEFIGFVQDQVQQPPYTADAILGAIAGAFAPGLGESNSYRSQWCNYFASGAVDAGWGTPVFPPGTLVQNMGYWNLLYDQLGDEGFDYVADANGYTSNVINWNSADAMQANNDYGSGVGYYRLDGGYSILFEQLAEAVTGLMQDFPGSGIFYGQQLTRLEEATDNTTSCLFNNDQSSPVVADQLFLAMPRRSLELVAAGCDPDYLLNQPDVKFYLESSINQPSVKAVLVFDQAWWTSSDCKYNPQLTPQTAQGVGGPTITDLPLRQIYYFANNIPGGPGESGGPYVLLASYDDMNYTNFWNELETNQDFTEAPSQYQQPLHGPTAMDPGSPFAQMLLKQLAEVHGIPVEQIPVPLGCYFQDWGQDPFGAGYHGWASHYNICQVMDNVRAPYQNILGQTGRNLYIIGSCYSFDQAWVEGAFCTAESVLQDFLNLPPFNNVSGYTLICKLS
ncbi:MAG: hypothetical protein OHK0022_51630 [Roseiflexaceae bacterium]